MIHEIGNGISTNIHANNQGKRVEKLYKERRDSSSNILMGTRKMREIVENHLIGRLKQYKFLLKVLKTLMC